MIAVRPEAASSARIGNCITAPLTSMNSRDPETSTRIEALPLCQRGSYVPIGGRRVVYTASPARLTGSLRSVLTHANEAGLPIARSRRRLGTDAEQPLAELAGLPDLHARPARLLIGLPRTTAQPDRAGQQNSPSRRTHALGAYLTRAAPRNLTCRNQRRSLAALASRRGVPILCPVTQPPQRKGGDRLRRGLRNLYCVSEGPPDLANPGMETISANDNALALAA